MLKGSILVVAGVGGIAGFTFENQTGSARTISLNGRIDADNPFFEDLGTNGRSCVTCHQPDDRGLIRVGLDVPANAEFAIDSVRDPYRCGPATNDAAANHAHRRLRAEALYHPGALH